MNVDYDLTLSIMKLAREEKNILSDPSKKLTSSESAVLIELAEKDGVTATEISNTMGFEKSFFTHVMKELVAEGYITVSRIDGRTDNISITEKGKTVAEETKKRLSHFVDTLFHDCPEENKELFRQNINILLETETR